MKKILKVDVEKIPTTTYKYKYTYVDNKGVKVRMEGFESMDDLEKDIKKKMKHLSNEDYKLVIAK